MKFSPAIWSSDPLERLRAVARLTPSDAKALQEQIGEGVPSRHRPWPFGMPTSVNPYVVCLGISPGAAKGDTGEKNAPYSLPTVGHPHEGFGGETINSTDPEEQWDALYWRKVRGLCIGLLTGFKRELDSCQALALSGHLNLGTAQNGRGTESVIDETLARLVPDWICHQLKPRLVICFGFRTFLPEGTKPGSEKLRRLWRNTRFSILFDEKDEEQEWEKFQWNGRTLWFRHCVIRTNTDDKLTVVLWPNHPSRPPFGGGPDSEAWRKAIAHARKWLK